MKTLMVLAAAYLGKTGSDVGFIVKSLKSGKSFKVVSKTPSGSKFVIVDTVSGDEFVVDGGNARYSMASNGNAKKIAELEEIIAGKEDTLATLEGELEELNEQLYALQDEAV